MNTQSLSNIVQILAGIAVLMGLGLVVWELRQTREIALAQQASDGFAVYSQRVQAVMGENAAHSLAKACDEPDSLTTEDMIILDQVYTETLNNMRGVYAVQLVSRELAIYDWEHWAVNFRTIFATEYGRWWWKRGGWEPEIRKAGDKFMQENAITDCKKFYDGYRNRHEVPGPDAAT
jgi:hypothetical protein